MKDNIFEDNLEFGNEQEKIVNNKIIYLIPSIFKSFIKEYEFSKYSKEQLLGKDGGIHIDWDVKVRDNSYRWVKDIAIEVQVNKKKKMSWFYKIADIIFYGIKNEENTDYIKEKAWILFLKQCRIYFTDNRLDKYQSKWAKTVNKNGNVWWTENKIIPIEDFPKDCLIPFPKEYWDNNNNIDIKPKIKSKTISKPKSKQNKMDSFYDLIGLV